ncbi:MAG: ABC transporter ATP-binding protein [Thermanaerothrix sp.]|nr:ABC transporter ATP-binding protein [Thermanaerothrix sp.]
MWYLQIENLRKSYGRGEVIKNLSLSAMEGECVALLGPSGCGKSTLLRCVAGLEDVVSGSIRLADRDITFLPPKDRNVGMVFQSYALFPNLSVFENVAFGLSARGMRGSQLKERVKEAVSMVELEGLEDRMTWELSGGQRQRVALARALAIRPKLLLLDEPLSALDAKVRERLREHIRAIQRELRITTLFVTHDQEEAMEVADTIAVMKDGQILQRGTPEEVYRRPKGEFVANFMGRANPLPRDLAEALGARGSARWMIRPEALKITDPWDPRCKVKGKVEDVIPRGSLVRIKVKTNHGSLWVETLNGHGTPIPTSGDPVGILGSQEDLVAVDQR